MIWLIGNKGMLGTQLELRFRERGMEVAGSDREVDITDPAALEDFAKGKDIGWIVNCSAFTAVDKAESEEETARRINALGVGNIARLAAKLGAKVVHFSTDYVFSGKASAPLREDDPTEPISAYGRTKLEGERLLKEATEKYFLFRISWLYGVHGPNFVKTMIRLMKEKEFVRVVNDQRGQPTYVAALIDNIVSLVERDSAEFGVYHYGDEAEISWYDFAVEIQELAYETGLLAAKIPVQAIKAVEYPRPAAVPAYSVFDKTKVRTRLGFAVKPWKDNLAEFFKEWKKYEYR